MFGLTLSYYPGLERYWAAADSYHEMGSSSVESFSSLLIFLFSYINIYIVF